MLVVATSTELTVAYAAALYAVIVIPAAITALKGHGIWLFGGVVMPLIWWYSAARLAMPGSWWEERNYGSDKRTAARERYGGRTAEQWLVRAALIVLASPIVVGFATAFLIG